MEKQQQIEFLNAYITVWDAFMDGKLKLSAHQLETNEANLVKLYRTFCEVEKLPFISADDLIQMLENKTPIVQDGFIVLSVLVGGGSFQPNFTDDDGLMFFTTEQEAKDEILDAIDNVANAITEGSMSEDSRVTEDDYLIVPAKYNVVDNIITCLFDGDKYAMLRTEDDWTKVHQTEMPADMEAYIKLWGMAQAKQDWPDYFTKFTDTVPAGWKFYNPEEKEAIESEADFDCGDTAIGVLISTKGYWIVVHVSGRYSTVVVNKSEYGTFEACVKLIEEELGEKVN
jgi:hypothetical protein